MLICHFKALGYAKVLKSVGFRLLDIEDFPFLWKVKIWIFFGLRPNLKIWFLGLSFVDTLRRLWWRIWDFVLLYSTIFNIKLENSGYMHLFMSKNGPFLMDRMSRTPNPNKCKSVPKSDIPNFLWAHIGKPLFSFLREFIRKIVFTCRDYDISFQDLRILNKIVKFSRWFVRIKYLRNVILARFRRYNHDLEASIMTRSIFRHLNRSFIDYYLCNILSMKTWWYTLYYYHLFFWYIFNFYSLFWQVLRQHLISLDKFLHFLLGPHFFEPFLHPCPFFPLRCINGCNIGTRRINHIFSISYWHTQIFFGICDFWPDKFQKLFFRFFA